MCVCMYVCKCVCACFCECVTVYATACHSLYDLLLANHGLSADTAPADGLSTCLSLARDIELACLKVTCLAAKRLSGDGASDDDIRKRVLKRFHHTLDKRLAGIQRCTAPAVRVSKPGSDAGD